MAIKRLDPQYDQSNMACARQVLLSNYYKSQFSAKIHIFIRFYEYLQFLDTIQNPLTLICK